MAHAPQRRPLRIAIDVTALLPEQTGVDVFLVRLVEHLGRIDQENDYRIYVNYEDRDLLRDQLPANFAVVPLALRPRSVRLLGQQIGLPVQAAALHVDVVHSPSFIMPMYRGRARHVLTVHDMTSFTRPDTHSILHGSEVYRWAVRTSIRRSDLVTVPSLHSKRSILDQVAGVASGKIEVVALGVGDEFTFKPSPSDRQVIARLGLPEPYILFVGTLEPRKNLGRLVEAYRRLIASGATVERLVIAGRLGWRYGELLARLDDPELRGRVHVAGYVAAEDLPAVYRSARLFVYPSIEEGFGFPPLEAMACGVPTVSSSTSSLQENLDGAACLVDPYNVDALAAAIRQLLTDEPERSRLRAAGIERAARFCWNETARHMLGCYQKAHACRP